MIKNKYIHMKCIALHALTCAWICVTIVPIYSATLELNMEMPMPRGTNVVVPFTVSVSDIPTNVVELVNKHELGAVTLDDSEVLSVACFYISKFQFVQAEKLAKTAMSRSSSNKEQFWILAISVMMSRGEYEAACQAFRLLELQMQNESAIYWRVYIQSAILQNAASVTNDASLLVASGKANANQYAMAAVLATCLQVSDGKHLFKALIDRVDRKALIRVTENTHGYLRLCHKYGFAEEKLRIERIIETQVNDGRKMKEVLLRQNWQSGHI